MSGSVVSMYVKNAIISRSGTKLFVDSVDPLNLVKLEDLPLDKVVEHGIEGEYLACKIASGSNMVDVKTILSQLKMEFYQC